MTIVTANPNTGSILTQSGSNPEWSSMSLVEETYAISAGILQKVKLSGLLKAKTEVLEGIVKAFNIKSGDKFPLDVTLVVTESHYPFWKGQKCKINPTSGEVFLKEGREVFRKTDVVMGKTPNTYVFVNVEASVQQDIEVINTAPVLAEA